jgi:hypothetical protein
MKELEPRFEITRKEIVKDKALKAGAWLAPVSLSVIPALIFFIFFIFSIGTVTAIIPFSLAVISLIVGFIIGLGISGGLMLYRSRWLAQVRERLAVDGIKAEEVDWFKNELTSNEKKALKEIQARDLLLADAYRETLASRLTAMRIIKSSRHELLLSQRRQNKLKYLKSENSAEFQEEIKKDIEKLSEIKKEAEQMSVEAETRLQMIEAAAARGGSLADSQIALKKLSARASELPLALESARMEEEIRRELEKEIK